MDLQVKVFLNESAFRSDKCIFERVIAVTPTVVIPFQTLISDLKFLFGVQSCVTFNLV